MAIRWTQYLHKGFHDELIGPRGKPWPAAAHVAKYLRSLKDNEIEQRRAAAELAIRAMGITFTVYNQDGGAIDRAWPFDIIPRIIEKREWTRIEIGRAHV